LIELKRDRTPREVVAQTLDYASWASGLDTDDVAAIYRRFAPGRSLADEGTCTNRSGFRGQPWPDGTRAHLFSWISAKSMKRKRSCS
jgi:hypothetical protein